MSTMIEAMPKSPKRGKKKDGAGKKAPMAAGADRHVLYQQAVQCVEAEIDFVDETFRDLRGRHAAVLREDFCGTANSACEWVRRRRTNRAVGVDLDRPTLDWGIEHNIGALPAQARARVELLEENVLSTNPGPADIVLAMNFSYFLFDSRAVLRSYFENVRRGLVDGGIFFLDAYGGYEAHQVVRDRRKIDPDDGAQSFTYIWDQHAFSPITHMMKCFIHFHFPDGSKMNKAFEYTWRLWSLPEIRELLEEAGFARTTIYWEGTDEDSGEGNGEYEPEEQGDADPAWVCYLVAEK